MRKPKLICAKAQTAVEYMLLLGVVTAIVLVGLKTYIPQSRKSAELYFNEAGAGIAGNANPCGDGTCDGNFEARQGRCCVDCGGCVVVGNPGNPSDSILPEY